MNSEIFLVELPEGDRIRTDSFIASLGMFSRSQIARRSVQGFDSDGRALKMSRRLQNGDIVRVDWDDPLESDIHPEPLDLDVIYEDENCIVINKSQGLVVHPAPGHIHGTLVQGLLHRYSGMKERFDGIRPGIVHRLDKDTSGVMIAAKTPEALNFLAEQFSRREVGKVYLAISRGIPSEESAEILHPIGRDPYHRKRFNINTPKARTAVTRYQIISKNTRHALLRIEILTGRTHQIRVHLKSAGTSVLGDPVYGRIDPEYPNASLMLHSWKLSLALPGGEYRQFTADIPLHLRQAMDALGLDLPG